MKKISLLFVAGFIGSPSMNFSQGQFVSQHGTLRFVNQELDFQVPAVQADSFKSHVGKDVIFGFRPENIHDRQSPGSKTLTESQRITIDVTEPVGSETFVYFTLSGQTASMRVSSDVHYQPGEVIEVCFDTDRLYFFDAQTEHRLTY